ncbi:hypothetical protein PFISCL1PPCAC_3302, partial [Pristionchus fissidentatus]
CLGYSWYLAADMQMYLFTPLLIIPLALKPITGLVVATLVFTFSTAVNIFLVYYYHWPVSDTLHEYYMKLYKLYFRNYSMLMYESPLIRCQIYIMGLMVGWFMQTKKQMKIHPV